MKQIPLELSKNPEHRAAAIRTAVVEMEALDYDHNYEVVIRNETVGKTLRQLRGHFGHILKQVSAYTGDDVNYLHKKMKSKFLSKIYMAEPANALQEQWVELLDIYLDTDPVRFEKQAKRISLSWITKDQMRVYIDQVLAYFRNEGVPVTEPDRNRDMRNAA